MPIRTRRVKQPYPIKNRSSDNKGIKFINTLKKYKVRRYIKKPLKAYLQLEGTKRTPQRVQLTKEFRNMRLTQGSKAAREAIKISEQILGKHGYTKQIGKEKPTSFKSITGRKLATNIKKVNIKKNIQN